jgi:hypothetical protein
LKQFLWMGKSGEKQTKTAAAYTHKQISRYLNASKSADAATARRASAASSAGGAAANRQRDVARHVGLVRKRNTTAAARAACANRRRTICLNITRAEHLTQTMCE